ASKLARISYFYVNSGRGTEQEIQGACVTRRLVRRITDRLQNGDAAGVAPEVLQAHLNLWPGRLQGEALGPLQNGHGRGCEHILHAKSLKIVETFNPV